MSECEGENCEAKQSREQDYLPEMALMSGDPADDERLCFHGRNVRHALSVRYGRQTKPERKLSKPDSRFDNSANFLSDIK